MKSDRDITRIKRATFLWDSVSETVCFSMIVCWTFVSAVERQSPSLDDLEKSLQNVNAMLQSAPPKPPVSFVH